MEFHVWLAFGLTAYLLGAVPTAYLVARAHGIDIRTVGSGNVGATNVLRALGRGWALATFAVDALKGFAPAFVFPLLASPWAAEPPPREHLGLWCAACAVAGHNWPVYLGFRGGKGVATSVGALTGLSPLLAAAGLVCWGVVFGLSRYVSLASIAATVVVCAGAWARPSGGDWVVPSAFTALGLVLILRHRGNIARLLKGTERRIAFRKTEGGAAGDPRP